MMYNVQNYNRESLGFLLGNGSKIAVLSMTMMMKKR
jgi:hypothetical protein